jgi:hypothetical protein
MKKNNDKINENDAADVKNFIDNKLTLKFVHFEKLESKNKFTKIFLNSSFLDNQIKDNVIKF